MGKIFVRQRHKVGTGEGQPRLAIVATLDTELKIYQYHIRKSELEHLAADAGAEIVYLRRGDSAEADEAARQPGAGRKRRRRPQNEG